MQKRSEQYFQNRKKKIYQEHDEETEDIHKPNRPRQLFQNSNNLVELFVWTDIEPNEKEYHSPLKSEITQQRADKL